MLERALTLIEKNRRIDRKLSVYIRIDLARSLWKLGVEHARARKLALDARDEAKLGGPPLGPLLASVERELQKH